MKLFKLSIIIIFLILFTCYINIHALFGFILGFFFLWGRLNFYEGVKGLSSFSTKIFDTKLLPLLLTSALISSLYYYFNPSFAQYILTPQISINLIIGAILIAIAMYYLYYCSAGIIFNFANEPLRSTFTIIIVYLTFYFTENFLVDYTKDEVSFNLSFFDFPGFKIIIIYLILLLVIFLANFKFNNIQNLIRSYISSIIISLTLLIQILISGDYYRATSSYIRAIDTFVSTRQIIIDNILIESVFIVLGCLTYNIINNKKIVLRINLKQYLKTFVFSIFIGIGVFLAKGCNIGALLIPVMTGSLSGWIFLLIMILTFIVINFIKYLINIYKP